MDISSSKVSESKKRKECPEFDDEEEEKMEKFYEIIRSFRDHASQLVFNSNIMPKKTEASHRELAEKIKLKKKKKKKKEKKADDKGKEGDSSSNHKDIFFMSPSETTTSRSSQIDTTRTLPNSDGTTLGVNVISDFTLQRLSGDQIHDDTQGLDLNLSL